jgi:hypothetical protein
MFPTHATSFVENVVEGIGLLGVEGFIVMVVVVRLAGSGIEGFASIKSLMGIGTVHAVELSTPVTPPACRALSSAYFRESGEAVDVNQRNVIEPCR